jgi:uncharacterized membrane protein YfcA
MTTVWVALVGLVAGIVSGFFGVGGAVVIIPGLVLLARMDQHTANGTSLASLLLPVGFLGAWQYYRMGKVNVPYAALIAVGLFLGAYLGARWAMGVPDALLRRAFGAMLLLMSVKLLFF